VGVRVRTSCEFSVDFRCCSNARIAANFSGNI
jgi:hypothetical protein